MDPLAVPPGHRGLLRLTHGKGVTRIRQSHARVRYDTPIKAETTRRDPLLDPLTRRIWAKTKRPIEQGLFFKIGIILHKCSVRR